MITEVGCGCFYLTILSNHTMTFHVFHAQCNCFILFFGVLGGRGGLQGKRLNYVNKQLNIYQYIMVVGNIMQLVQFYFDNYVMNN